MNFSRKLMYNADRACP